MSEKDNKVKESKAKIISKRDLGNGKMEMTLAVNTDSLNDYIDMFNNIENINVEGTKIASGSVKSRYSPVAPTSIFSEYTSNQVPYTQALKTPEDPHKKIEFAVELYHKEPIVGTVIDMMVDFSASGFENDSDNPDIKKLYDTWSREVDLPNLVEGIFLEYYRSGNVTIYRSDKSAKVTVKDKNGGKSKEYNFPAGYTILNPMNVYIEGSLLFNQEVVTLRLSQELIDMVQGKTGKNDKGLIEKIPDNIIRAVRSGSNLVELDPKLVSRLTRKKQPYERYASPFIERIFEPVMYKQKLRMMDMSTIEGLVNQLITVTVGNDNYPADDSDLEAIAELFQTPNKAYSVFWNHTLNVRFHKPEGIDTLTQDKYKQVNDDILSGLGISRVLIDGQGSNFSTAWISILSLIERLENSRKKVKKWIEDEYRRIAEENGLKTFPTIRFNRVNLREDNYIRDVLIAMYDRGLLDEENILTETGRDYQSIVETKKRNKKNEELFLPPVQPFQGNNGRPPGSNENGYSQNRDSSPKQSSNTPKTANKTIAYYNNIEEDYEKELVEIYDNIMDNVEAVAKENNGEDGRLLETLIATTLIASFKTISSISQRYLYQAYEGEYSNHSSALPDTSNAKSRIKEWNDSYLLKLANDIKDNIKNNMQKGLDVSNAIGGAFYSNKYRIKLIAKEGLLEATRQAKIGAHQHSGFTKATWIAHMDDMTCEICKGLHGHSFNINEIPPRPHSSCRCDLEFS